MRSIHIVPVGLDKFALRVVTEDGDGPVSEKSRTNLVAALEALGATSGQIFTARVSMRTTGSAVIDLGK